MNVDEKTVESLTQYHNTMIGSVVEFANSLDSYEKDENLAICFRLFSMTIAALFKSFELPYETVDRGIDRVLNNMKHDIMQQLASAENFKKVTMHGYRSG